MTTEDVPAKGEFFIDEAVGITKEEYDMIVAEMRRYDDSNMNMSDIVKEVVKDRNPYDVMVGIKLALLLYKNEGRL